jgi:hypothetical protein
MGISRWMGFPVAGTAWRHADSGCYVIFRAIAEDGDGQGAGYRNTSINSSSLLLKLFLLIGHIFSGR